MDKAKRSTSVRWQDVQFERTGAIPVLVGCGQRKADGYLLPAKRQQFVRVVDSSTLQQDKKGAYSSDRSLVGLVLLLEALKGRERPKLDFAKQLLWPDLGMQKLEGWLLERNPLAVLGRLLPDGIKRVEFVVWQDTRDDEYTALQPGLFCPDVRSALCALTLLYGEEHQGVCQQCGKLLSRERSTKLYCSASCRAKWHRKHPNRRASKSRKTSTRKRR